MLSCAPDVFMLNRADDVNSISGTLVGNYRNFERVNENSFILTDTLIATLRAFNVSNQRIKFNIEFIKNPTLRLNFRTVKHNFTPEIGISLFIYDNSYILSVDNKVAKRGLLNFSNNKILADITNDGNYLKVKLNCTEIEIKELTKPATEFMIVENFSDNAIKISGIKWENIK